MMHSEETDLLANCSLPDLTHVTESSRNLKSSTFDPLSLKSTKDICLEIRASPSHSGNFVATSRRDRLRVCDGLRIMMHSEGTDKI
jgi:hypothetical protein